MESDRKLDRGIWIHIYPKKNKKKQREKERVREGEGRRRREIEKDREINRERVKRVNHKRTHRWILSFFIHRFPNRSFDR